MFTSRDTSTSKNEFHATMTFTEQISLFGPNTGKYRPEKTPYLDTFHAVLFKSKAPNFVRWYWDLNSTKVIIYIASIVNWFKFFRTLPSSYRTRPYYTFPRKHRNTLERVGPSGESIATPSIFLYNNALKIKQYFL